MIKKGWNFFQNDENCPKNQKKSPLKISFLPCVSRFHKKSIKKSAKKFALFFFPIIIIPSSDNDDMEEWSLRYMGNPFVLSSIIKRFINVLLPRRWFINLILLSLTRKSKGHTTGGNKSRCLDSSVLCVPHSTKLGVVHIYHWSSCKLITYENNYQAYLTCYGRKAIVKYQSLWVLTLFGANGCVNHS